MNNVMIFQSKEFGSVRTTLIDGQPWLVSKDVADILGYRNNRDALSRHVDPEDKAAVVIHDGRQNRTQTVINESGFYSLVLSSKLPAAKRFKRWMTTEVLPTLRRTGGYVSNADMFADAYLPFVDEQTKQLFKLQCRVIDQLNDRIKSDEPKVRFADHVADTTDLIDMNRMAKLCADNGIRIGRNRLFAWMRLRGILMMDNIPYQKYIESGYFRVKESVYECKRGKKTYQQTFVTGKGQQFILLKLMDEFGG